VDAIDLQVSKEWFRD
jgi:hypothetical protein